MTTRLEPPRRVGDSVVAAIVETRIDARRIGQAAVVTGSHAPCAILIARRGEVAAFAPDGRALPLDDVTTLVPDALARLLSA